MCEEEGRWVSPDVQPQSGHRTLLKKDTDLSCGGLCPPPQPRVTYAPQASPALVGGQACGSVRLCSCQLARPALLPWQSFSMSVGRLLPLHLSLGPEPLQGGPGGCKTEGRFPEAPGVLGPGQALTPAGGRGTSGQRRRVPPCSQGNDGRQLREARMTV